MKRILLLILLCISTSLVAQTTTIPDPIFETFLEANSMGNGIAGDNLVTTANIENIETLDIRNLGIGILTGIEGFISLTTLKCSGNNLMALDLSENTNLITLLAGGNSLDTINLSGLTALDYVTLHDNSLDTIDISNNPSLGSLTAWNNGLTSIDITNCTGLTELYLNDNMLTSLDLSLFTNLNKINVTNNQLTTLNLKNGTNNIKLNYSSAVNATGNPDLECIKVDDPAYSMITWADIGTTTFLSEDCDATTNVPNAIFENYLETHDADGTIVPIGDATSMGNGTANDNIVKTPRIESVITLDVSSLGIDDLTGIEDFKALASLSCQDNSLTILNLSNNSTLIALFATDNDLKVLDMKNGNNSNVSDFYSTNNPNLQCIKVDNATDPNLSSWTKDTATSFSEDCNDTYILDDNFENYLETHDADGNTVAIGGLTSMGNGIANDDLVYTASIENVIALSMGFKGIANLTGIGDFAALETLSCPFNDIETVDLSSNLALTSLTATSSKIKFLNVSNNSNLTSLTVSNNDIEFLDLSNNSNLTYIAVSNNELTFLNNQNGNNGNVTGFVATGNSSLECINVDDETASYLNNTSIWIKDTAANYGIHCHETDVPNDIFEYYLETHDADGNSVAIGDANSMGNGIDNDNRVNTIAINTVIRLDVYNLGIDNLTGIEGFVALTELYAYDNSFETIDLSNLSQLVKLFIHRGSLVALDVTANTLLEDLRADTNTLDQINLTNNPLLQILQLTENDIEEIDVTANTALTRFRIKGNPIKELDLSTNIALIELWVNACDLSYLNVNNGNNGILVNFFATNNPSLTCINVDNATDATAGNGSYSTWTKDGTASYSIHCNETYILDANFENYLETHDAAGTIVPLGDPTSMGNGIANDTYVTTANINTVTSLDVNSSSITDLTGIEGFTALETLHCYSNNLDALDISANTALKTVICYSNNLDELVLSTNVNLITLVAHTNVITSLNADTCTVLETFIVSNNNLDTLSVANGNNGNMSFDATGNPNLDCINLDNDTASYLSNWGKDPTASFNEHCYETYIPDANFEAFLEANNMGNGIANDNYVLTSSISGVQTLQINNLFIANLTGIEAFTALETLYCHRNDLMELDLSANTALTNLRCYNNQLDELDLSTNTNLEFLDANTNTIIEIDLQLNTALKTINLDGNDLTVLNLDTCVVLENLSVDNNNLNELNIVNGNNAAIIEFDASSNPNLLCINVDDPTQSYLNSWVLNVDESTSFGEHCYETFVSDANFEYYLETHDASGTVVPVGDPTSMGNGIANDNYVYTTAINTVTSLNVSNLGIADLTGIANFTELVSLDATNNGLTNLDLTQNTNLTTLDVSNNALTQLHLNNGNNAVMTSSDSVIITGNSDLACINVDDPTQSYLENWTTDPTASFGNHCYETYIHDALFENFLETRDASRNVVDLGDPTSMGNGIANDNYVFTDRISEVTNLNVGFIGIEDLTGIEAFTALQELRCNHNELEELDVSKNIALLKLTCQYNQIDSLDLSANVNLAHFRANHNGLTDLDIGDNAVLDEIYLDGNSLETLNVDSCVLLERLDINDNNLSTLSIVNGNNSILQLAAADNPNLTCINVDDPTQSYLEDWVTDVENPFSIYCFATVVTDLNFEAYLETHDANGIQVELGSDTSMGNGILEDGYVTTENIEEVVNLDISNLAIENLTGLENFTALESLTCNLNTINVLDVSNNSNLTTLIASSNINLSTVNTTNLLTLETLTITENSLLTSLDVTTNTVLTSLDINNNGISTLDISQNTGLITLNVSNNGIDVLDISQNISLTTLNISNNGIDVLDVSLNISLVTLNLSENELTELVLSQNSLLEMLDVSNNELVRLDIRNGANALMDNAGDMIATGNLNLSCIHVDNATPAATYLFGWSIDASASFGEHCFETYVPDDNFEYYLERHDALGNIVDIGHEDSMGNGVDNDNYVYTAAINTVTSLDLSSLDVSVLTGIEAFVALEYLNCNFNTIEVLDVSNNTNLNELYVSLNATLTSVITTDLAALHTLSIINNSLLTSVDVTTNTGLVSLYLKNNGLTELDVTQNTGLETLEFHNNVIESIDLTQNTSLVTLEAANNDLGTLGLGTVDVTQNTNLEVLDLSNTGLETLDVTQNVSLTALLASNNGLETVDLDQNINIETLSLSDNELTALVLTQNSLLELLSIPNNKLTELVLIQNPLLKLLDVSNNELEMLDLRNGANGLMSNYGDMVAVGNPNLSCINVDDASATYLDNWVKDASASFGVNCYETYVPDDNFENYLETHDASGAVVPINDPTSMGNGIANDNIVYTNRISGVTSLNVSNLSIAYLTGIEGFTALESLICFDNSLSTLVVSANTALNTLVCYRNSLDELDLSANTALTTLVCYFNQLTELDITANPNLEIIEAGENQLTTLDVHLNTGLTQIALYNNNLTALSVDACIALERLNVSNNNDLTELRIVNGNNVGITFLNATGNPNLMCINVDDPTQSYLDDWFLNEDDSTSFGEHCNETYVPDAIFEDYLETHDADGNTVDVGDITSMGNGVANDNYVSTKRIEVVTVLTVYDLDIVNLTGIEAFTALEELDCRRNLLTMLDVTQNVLLTELYFGSNQLTSIDVTNNTALTSLSFISNRITSIDLSQNVLLDYFDANENQFTSLDFSNNPLMVEIDCSENFLTSLNLSQCTVLEELYCNYNEFQTLDLSSNTALLYFEAEYNFLTSIDVSQNLNLERFSVENNQLTRLDLSLNINIEEIMCGDNSLTSLNVKNGYNTNIGLFWIENNPNLTCVLVDDASYSFAYTIRDFQSQYNEVTCGVQVSPKVFLQGAALNPNTGEEDLMRDDLRVAGILPTMTPYSDEVTCKTSIFNVTGDDAIVDWVWVELRDATDNTLVIDSQSALLQRDGDVVNVDGVTAVGFNEVSANDYYIVIKHRNHLGIMTDDTIDLFKTETILDFTDANDQITFGTDAQTTFGMESGVVGLWAGNTNGDGQLNYLGASSDITSIRSQVFNDPDNSVFGGPPLGTYQSEGYTETDVNMDGVTVYSGGTSDILFIRDNIFNNPSNSFFGGPPLGTYLFIQQLPEGVN